MLFSLQTEDMATNCPLAICLFLQRVQKQHNTASSAISAITPSKVMSSCSNTWMIGCPSWKRTHSLVNRCVSRMIPNHESYLMTKRLTKHLPNSLIDCSKFRKSCAFWSLRLSRQDINEGCLTTS